MALTVFCYLKPKDALSGDKHINGVQACLYTTDPSLSPSDSIPERIALATAAVQAALGGNYPADYFTTERTLGVSVGNDMAEDGDLIVIQDSGVTEVGVP
jgi:hypothetical protein